MRRSTWKEIDLLRMGAGELLCIGPINRDSGRRLLMAESGDMRPPQLAEETYRSQTFDYVQLSSGRLPFLKPLLSR